MKPSVSIMSGKLEGIDAINTNTVTNEFCKKAHSLQNPNSICTYCYSMYMLNTYRKNCQDSFQRNSDILASDVPIDKIKFKSPYVRYNGHGELINENHFINLCAIAASDPDRTFVLWTKRTRIVRQNIDHVPPNMILVYSNPAVDRVMTVPPRGFHRVFNNVTEKYTGEANCTGQKCIDCLLCYKFDTEKVIVEHVK